MLDRNWNRANCQQGGDTGNFSKFSCVGDYRPERMDQIFQVVGVGEPRPHTSTGVGRDISTGREGSVAPVLEPVLPFRD